MNGNSAENTDKVMSSTKYEGELVGILNEIKEWDCSRVDFEMRGNKEQLEQAGF